LNGESSECPHGHLYDETNTYLDLAALASTQGSDQRYGVREECSVSNRTDLDAIRAALDYLPRECQYHGDRLEMGDIVSGGGCCDTGRPARARRLALAAVERLESTGVEGA
jgi:hypothetical protein